MNKTELIQVSAMALVEEQKLRSPAVILHDEKTNKILPIWIGHSEAKAIALVMQKHDLPRPMTHKLMQNIIETLNGKIKKIIINKIMDNTFYSIIVIEKDNIEIEIDSRPSDSIALALHVNAPIFIAKEIIDAIGQINPFDKNPKTKFTEEEINKIGEMLKKAREKETENRNGGA